MSYIKPTQKRGVDFLKNINTRKEFYIFKKELDEQQEAKKNKSDKKIDIVPRESLNDIFKQINPLVLASYQKFIANFINPNTPYKRLLLKWDTGIGKTVAALNIAKAFITHYQKESIANSLEIGSVFIIGFTSHIFKQTLLKFPEFGFISYKEKNQLAKLKKAAANGTKINITNLHNFMIRIKKRLSNRKRIGFFKFFGYREFVGKLFTMEGDTSIQDLDENTILENVKSGKIKLNEELIQSFNNSLLICDEIHDVYNSLNKNNWGVAIQTILNNIPNLRAVFLSATPINNNPTEIVNLMNLLIPNQEAKMIDKHEFFSNTITGILKPDVLGKMKELLTGRISFIKDNNPAFFPEKIYIGEKMSNVSYLKFTRCPMSEFYYKSYKPEFIVEGDPGHETSKLGIGARYLNDFVLPNPDGGGMFESNVVKSKLASASQSWKDKIGIDWVDGRIVGSFTELKTLKKYSAKYWQMMHDTIQELRKSPGKFFIYHNDVHMSGVLFLEEIFKNNGAISEFASPSDSTLCSFCGYENKLHTGKQGVSTTDDGSANVGAASIGAINRDPKKHKFIPLRYIAAHSDLDKARVIKSIDRFNNISNDEGQKICILIGSKMIKQSYDIKAIRRTKIMARPDNISTLIQIIGRSARKYSHVTLPIDQRNVEIQLYTNCIPVKASKKDGGEYEKSHEELKYMLKVNTFKIIQKIDKVMNEGSLDLSINVDKMFDKNGDFSFNDPLGPLPFKPDYLLTNIHANKNGINTDTFQAYYGQDYVNIIISILKRIFIEQDTVWTYWQLFEALKNFAWDQAQFNTRIINEENFQIALTRLIWDNPKNNTSQFTEPVIEKKTDFVNVAENIISSLYDPNDKVIVGNNGEEYMVVQAGEYYCMLSINKNYMKPIVDVDMPYRIADQSTDNSINLKQFLETRSIKGKYEQNKIKFIRKYRNLELVDMEDLICEYGTEFHQILIEEIIDYVFGVLIGRILRHSEYHDFYFKMLYYYDIIGIIIWASTVRDFMLDRYKQYISKTGGKKSDLRVGNTKKEGLEKNKNSESEKNKNSESEKNKNSESEKKGLEKEGLEKKIDESAVIRMLKSSINSAGCGWCPEEVEKRFYKSIMTSKLVKPSKEKKQRRVPANMLPIGHFLLDVPRFYSISSGNPSWTDVPSYVDELTRKWVENDLIIGYDIKSEMGVHVRFKLRSPIQNIQKFSDTRKIEKGTICTSKSKEFLLRIANSLGIDITKNVNTIKLCSKIRTKIIHNEIKERMNKKSNIKWFYSYFEAKPIL